MNTDYETAAWARHHGRVTAAITQLLRSIDVGFAALNRREFEAPWKARRRHRRV